MYKMKQGMKLCILNRLNCQLSPNLIESWRLELTHRRTTSFKNGVYLQQLRYSTEETARLATASAASYWIPEHAPALYSDITHTRLKEKAIYYLDYSLLVYSSFSSYYYFLSILSLGSELSKHPLFRFRAELISGVFNSILTFSYLGHQFSLSHI